MTDEENSRIIWPMQCKCGHIYLERYTQNDTYFCWCGFCKNKHIIRVSANKGSRGLND
jgi:hypothetical protein